MPTRRKGESRSQFVSRCIPVVLKDGSAKSQSQAVAMCNSMWDRSLSSNLQAGAVDGDKDTRTLVHITAQADGSQGRTEYRGTIEYFVVPVAGLGGDTVIKGVNSLDYELVPEEVISRAPSAWDGRYLFPDHPQPVDEGANRPEVIDNESFGQVFNSSYGDGKLRLEAWIDVARAKELGGEPLRVYTECKAGNMVEVSTSGWTTMAKVSGVWAGQRYGYRWVHIAPDHLAMGLYGKRGAYSIEDGGGAPRSNVDSDKNDEGSEEAMSVDSSTMQVLKGMFARVFSSGDDATTDDLASNTSDVALRKSLARALKASQPAYYGILDVDPDEGTVVFEKYLDGRWTAYQISFTKDDKDNVELAGEAVQVKIVRTYRPLEAAPDGEGEDADPDAGNSGDSGVSSATNIDQPNNGPGSIGQTQEATMVGTSSDALAALVTQVLAANADAGMTEEDHGEHLRSLPESALKAMLPAPATEGGSEGKGEGEGAGDSKVSSNTGGEDDGKGSGEDKEVKVASQAAEPAPKRKTLEEFMAEAPEEVQAVVANAAQVTKTRKTALIKAICSQSGGAVEEKDLAGRSLEDLTLMAKLSGVEATTEDQILSYVGLPMPQAPADGGRMKPAPDTWGYDKKTNKVAKPS